MENLKRTPDMQLINELKSRGFDVFLENQTTEINEFQNIVQCLKRGVLPPISLTFEQGLQTETHCFGV